MPELPVPALPGLAWTAAILSAGESRRFHGEPKALLDVGGEPALVHIARICREAGAERTLAVLGPHRAEIERGLDRGSVEVLENPEWSSGRTGSVQVGLRAAGEAEAVLVWPVDHPFVAESTLHRLVSAAERDTLAVWLIPSFRGEGGHPVLLRRPAIARVLDLAPSTSMRSLLPGLGPQVRHVNVEDPGVLENADSPDAYWSALGAWKGREAFDHGP